MNIQQNVSMLDTSKLSKLVVKNSNNKESLKNIRDWFIDENLTNVSGGTKYRA